MIKKEDLVSPDLLSNDQIADLLPVIDELTAWAKQVQAIALTKALEGKILKGFKLVEGKSNRIWVDMIEVADKLKLKGFGDTVIYKKELKGIGDIESLVGKKNFESILGHLVMKPTGKPALVPESDKRPVFNSNAQAAADFKN